VIPGVFRVTGRALLPTPSFRLEGERSQRIDATMITASTHHAGTALLVVSALVGASMTALALWGAFNLQLGGDNSCFPCGGAPSNAGAVAVTVGAVVSVFDLGFAVAGVAFSLRGSKVVVTF
jgi:hypothetical protein